MRKIVYYVAISLDSYICGPNESIEGYVSEGSGLDQYLGDLKDFDTVIIGKNTYEFGFNYGVIPGQPAYEHMDHYIFSDSAFYQNTHDKVYIVPRDISKIRDLKIGSGSDIYLCGGSIFAGWLLNHQLIDEVKLKLNPVIFGDGIPLFSGIEKKVNLELLSIQQHDHGMLINSYKVKYY